MKKIIILLLILGLVLGFGIWDLRKINHSSKDMINDIDKLANHVVNKEWDNAISKYKAISSKWSKYENIWSIMIDHFEVDQIETSIARLKVYIEQENKSDSLAEISNLKVLIEHIPAKEAVTLKNIF